MPKSLASGAVLQRIANSRTSTGDRTHLMTASEKSYDPVSFFQILIICGHTDSSLIILGLGNDGLSIAVQKMEVWWR